MRYSSFYKIKIDFMQNNFKHKIHYLSYFLLFVTRDLFSIFCFYFFLINHLSIYLNIYLISFKLSISNFTVNIEYKLI